MVCVDAAGVEKILSVGTTYEVRKADGDYVYLVGAVGSGLNDPTAGFLPFRFQLVVEDDTQEACTDAC